MWGGGSGGGYNLSGMYSGTVTDSALGTGTATANLAHSGGSGHDPLGGWLSFTFGSTTYSNPTSGALPSGGGEGGGGGDWGSGGGGHTTVHGVFVSSIASVACTFVFRASFNPSSFELSGEYKARSGCSGESGTFLLTQQCYYNEYGSLRRNTSSGPGACT